MKNDWIKKFDKEFVGNILNTNVWISQELGEKMKVFIRNELHLQAQRFREMIGEVRKKQRKKDEKEFLGIIKMGIQQSSHEKSL